MSFVDKDQLEPGCSVLLNHKSHSVVGVLGDDTDPMVSVMKLEKAPTVIYWRFYIMNYNSKGNLR